MKDKNMESINNIDDENAPQKQSASVENCIYYGVYIPQDTPLDMIASANANVFTKRNMALVTAKQNKKARFKGFGSFREAADFAYSGKEPLNTTIESSSLKNTTDAPVLLGEKPSPFKGPKPQDLIILRKAIEKGDYESVEIIIWKNPRYLISSGDTPSILQEGSRYNALHIASKAKNKNIAELILNTISNIAFIKLLYGDNNTENAEERANVFLDLYLNTPDKGLNETPLHFAVKFGAADVVELLVSYPQCDKTVKNKYGQTPNNIICDRYGKSDPNLYKRIEQLLEETYYVPVLRAEDNSVPPKIGEPFSPGRPLVLDVHPTSPRLEIQAYAGPMNKEGAENFRKVWKTPPRSLRRTPSRDLNDSMESISSLRYKDPLKGLELVGRTLATQYEISWKEYWSFLNSFVDIASEEGLILLENHLKSRVLNTSRSIINLDNSICDRSNLNVSSVSDLCNALQAFHINSSVEDSFQDELDTKIASNFSPFLCLEKACQVFAYRFANNILNALNGNLINILDIEVKQLEIVILSYMSDNRFKNINFNCVHCRLSYLIAQKLYFKFDQDSDRIAMYKKIESLIEICTNSFDCFSSDDESVHTKDVVPMKKGTSIKKQLLCLVHSILNHFNHTLKPHCDNLTEKDCVGIWEQLTPCTCVLYARKSRKGSNLQRNNSRRYNHGFEYVSDPVKRLFQDEKEDYNCNDEDCVMEDLYFTPISSPVLSEDESDDDDFVDAFTEDNYDVYIEGTFPTKTDGAVFNALKYSACEISRNLYPNIYLWRHKISQFPEEQRNSWKSLKSSDCDSNITSTPQKLSGSLTSTPSKSWLRVTGVNSPKRTRLNSISSCI